MAEPKIATEDEETDAQPDDDPETAADGGPEVEDETTDDQPEDEDTVTENADTDDEDTEEPTTDDETEEEEEEPVEEVDLPEDDDEVDEDGSPGGSLLGGTTFGISNKVLLGVGVAAIVAVLIIHQMNTGPQNASKDRYESDDDMEEELEEGSPAAAQKDVTEAGGSPAFSEQAQQSAIDEVFG